MNILYISTSCSEHRYNEIFNLRSVKAIEPQQKFNALIIRGVSEVPNVYVTALSSLPVSSSSCDTKSFGFDSEMISEKLVYWYIAFRNGRFSRYFDLYRNTRIYLERWINENKDKDCYIVVDALSVFMVLGCFNLIRKANIPVVGIVTDLPELTTKMKNRKETLFKRLAERIIQRVNTWTLSKYDAYITLTESINDVINKGNKKEHLLMEGSVDSSLEFSTCRKDKPKSVVYAGGVYAKYGVQALAEAFASIETSAELHIYGDGSYVKELMNLASKYTNIKYMGMVSLEEIVRVEQRAFLLVNPRPSNEDFSKYSFPSKTLEYMASGTPLLSTRLSGIPEEYFNYIFTIEDETQEGIKEALMKVLSLDELAMRDKGMQAYNFVMKEKSNLSQGVRIVGFLKTLDV